MTGDLTALLNDMGSLAAMLVIIIPPIGVVCVMLNDYKHYRENHWQRSRGLAGFIRQEQPYIYLLALVTFLAVGELLLYSVIL